MEYVNTDESSSLKPGFGGVGPSGDVVKLPPVPLDSVSVALHGMGDILYRQGGSSTIPSGWFFPLRLLITRSNQLT